MVIEYLLVELSKILCDDNVSFFLKKTNIMSTSKMANDDIYEGTYPRLWGVPVIRYFVLVQCLRAKNSQTSLGVLWVVIRCGVPNIFPF